MQAVGLSASLGAFIAGALLAESAYRHELEADIEPFEGLLLGLFFTAVGMSLNLRLLVEQPRHGHRARRWRLLADQGGWSSMRSGAAEGLERRPRAGSGLRSSKAASSRFVLSPSATAGRMAPEPAELLSVVVTLSMAADAAAAAARTLDRAEAKAQCADFDALPEQGPPRRHRRLRPLRPDRGPHAARQGHPVHRARHRRRAGRIRPSSSAARRSMATPAARKFSKPRKRQGPRLRARHRRRRSSMRTAEIVSAQPKRAGVRPRPGP